MGTSPWPYGFLAHGEKYGGVWARAEPSKAQSLGWVPLSWSKGVQLWLPRLLALTG